MDFFLSMIPLWVYVAGGLVIALPLMYFFGPVIMGIWRIMPNWVRVALGAVVALFGVFVYGRHKGYKSYKKHQENLDHHAVENRRKIHDEVEKLTPTDVDKRIDRWMRD